MKLLKLLDSFPPRSVRRGYWEPECVRFARGQERGKIERAATRLRISRSLLYDRIQRHRILVSRM
jgi:DNA-binding NtrC family response regulator